MATAARPRQQKEQLHKVYQHNADVERKKEKKNCHQGAIVIACPFLEAAVRVLMLTWRPATGYFKQDTLPAS